MGETIEDGKGGGYSAQVSQLNRLQTTAITKSQDYYQNAINGKQWSMSVKGVSAAGIDNIFFYLKNTGTTTLGITDFRFASSEVTMLTIEKVTGTATFTNGVDVTPVPKNLGRTEIPDATVKTCDNVSGLTGGGDIYYMNLPGDSSLVHIRTSSNVIIPQGQAMAIKRSTLTGSITGTVSLVEIPDDGLL